MTNRPTLDAYPIHSLLGCHRLRIGVTHLNITREAQPTSCDVSRPIFVPLPIAPGCMPPLLGVPSSLYGPERIQQVDGFFEEGGHRLRPVVTDLVLLDGFGVSAPRSVLADIAEVFDLL